MSEKQSIYYTENMLIKIAKRRNNIKRNYLLVNPLQGKHLPVSPTKALELMENFGNRLKEKYINNKVLLIAFAETGTAIGASVASCLGENCIFMHTTRENISDNSKYLFFSEEHSHATEQRLCIDNFEEFLKVSDTILFIDDEITTGKTIINGVLQMVKKYPYIKDKKIVVGSLINRMGEKHLKRFKEYAIIPEYLIKLDSNNDYEKIAESIETSEATTTFFNIKVKNKFNEYVVNSRPEPRIGTLSIEYQKACAELYQKVVELCKIEFDCKSVLIMGTEEFMYPALFIGRCLENEYDDLKVRTHSTTRSPIATSNAENYPIEQCNVLNSFYEKSRETYIYNLEYYDKVIIITDSLSSDIQNGINSIVTALNTQGCNDINIIQWR